MGFFDVFLGAIKMNDDYDDDEYNEDDDLDEEDEEDEDFEDEEPRKLFRMKFGRKSGSGNLDEEDEEDSDEEDLEDEEEEEEKPRKSFFFFRGKKASRDIEDDEDEEDDEEDEEEEEEPPRAPKKHRKRDRNAGKSRARERAPRETSSYRTSQSDYTSSGAAFTGTTYNAETTDWSSVLREKPVKNSRNSQRKRNTGSRARVEVIRPRSMEETQDIAETLMSNSTVILNLEITDVETSQRIIDFSCGVCYALNGGLKQVANYFYILTPENVEISGDYTNMLNGDFDFPSIRSQY